MGFLGIFGKKKNDLEDLKIESETYKKRYAELDKLLQIIIDKSKLNSNNLKENLSDKDNMNLFENGIRIGKYDIASVENKNNDNDPRHKIKFFLKDREKDTIETFTFMEKIFNSDIYFDKKLKKHLPKDDEMLTKQSYQELKKRYASNFLTRLEDVKREYSLNENLKLETVNFELETRTERMKTEEKKKEKTVNKETESATEKSTEKNKKKTNEKKKEESSENKENTNERIYTYNTEKKFANEKEKLKRYNQLRKKFNKSTITIEEMERNYIKRKRAGFLINKEETKECGSKIYIIKKEILGVEDLCVKNNLKLGDYEFKNTDFKTYDEIEIRISDIKNTNYNFSIEGKHKDTGEIKKFNIEEFLKLGKDNLKKILKPKIKEGLNETFKVMLHIEKTYVDKQEKIKIYRSLNLDDKEVKNLLIVGDKSRQYLEILKNLGKEGEFYKNYFKNSSNEEKETELREKAKESLNTILEYFENGIKFERDENNKSSYEENTDNDVYKTLCKVFGKKQLDNKLLEFSYNALAYPYVPQKEKEDKMQFENDYAKNYTNDYNINDDLIDDDNIEDIIEEDVVLNDDFGI